MRYHLSYHHSPILQIYVKNLVKSVNVVHNTQDRVCRSQMDSPIAFLFQFKNSIDIFTKITEVSESPLINYIQHETIDY